MKVLKVLLALLTTLAVALTAALLFIQDKNRIKTRPAISRSTRTSSNTRPAQKQPPA